MADVTPILINQLAAQTTLADSDYFIVGGADAKKITVAQMKEALGINALNGKLTSKNVPVEIDTGVVTFNNVVARCSGNNVVISGNIRTAYKGIDSQFVFIRDPEYYPKHIVPFGINTSDGFVSTAHIETSGILKFNTASMNGQHDIYFNVSYII